ncbi:MAG: hypothetical protein AB2805_04295 [Candidatus Thiodiazotropha sp.]
MMETFSQRTAEGLRNYRLFRLALPPFPSFLDINVEKEVEKDRMVIFGAAEAHSSGTELDPNQVSALLQRAREIDQTFVRKAAVFPIDIRIQYQDIEHYRQQRFELLSETSYRIFDHWQDVPSFRTVAKELFSESQFSGLLHRLLSLYSIETHMLSRSIRLPNLLTMARDSVTQTISNVMENEAYTLSKSLAHTVYRKRS